MKTIPYTGAERRLVPNYFKYTCYIFTAGSRIVYLLSGDAAGTEKYLPPRPPCAVTPPKIGGEPNTNYISRYRGVSKAKPEPGRTPRLIKYTCYIFTAGCRLVYLLSGDPAGTECIHCCCHVYALAL